MMTDPIADMLTRVRNALAVERKTVEMPASLEKESVARVLKDEGYIEDFQVVGDTPQRLLKIYLKYGPLGEEVIHELKRVSRPGRRVYRRVGEIGHVRNGLGIWIVSTNKGIISDRQCRIQRVGGEVLCSVF